MNFDDTFSIGQFVKKMRVDKLETLHQVSKGTDIDMTMLSKIERADRLPTNEQAEKIAKYFRVSEDEFKTKLTAERIIKEYGINETTFNAIKLLGEQLATYLNNKNNAI